MPKITSIEPQKKNPKRFNVFLDGKFALGADEDLIVDYRLVPGKEIDAQMLERLLQEAEVGKMMEKMYVLFNIRQRSEKEVRNYLRNLSFKRKIKDKGELSSLAIDSVINKLNRKGMLNDMEFARSWVESRSKKYGPQRIKQELYEKGINKEIIEGLLRGGDENEVQTATWILEKKLNSWSNLDISKQKQKSYEFLLRRGYQYETVREVIEKIIK